MTTCRACPTILWLAVLCCGLASSFARAQIGFSPPTADEIAMKSEPKAPGASAVVLSYDELDDGDSGEVRLHVRLKVLTEGGLEAGTIELPDRIIWNDEFDRVITARTIHRNGSIVEFKATPQNSRVIDEASGRPRRVISLPDVEVGSILEYTCHFAGQNSLYTHLSKWYAPVWRAQGNFFMRSAHFQLKLPSNLDNDVTHWVAHLPGNAQPIRKKDRVTLDVADVPAAPSEDYMPPASSTLYGVRFFYYEGKRDKYWGSTGADVDDKWSEYTDPTKTVKAAAQSLVLPGDSEEQKLRKLYNAVQQMDNTDLTRAHTEREDKHVAHNSDDIWTRKRGDSGDLTLLFVALARAAGFKAYPMAVSSRDRAVFDQELLSWSQMDSLIAIVVVNGQEIFFDPGVRLCAFGSLAPWHSNVTGVSTEAKLVKIRSTPELAFVASRTERVADLTLTATGAVTGTLRIAWIKSAGLKLRRLAVSEDKHSVDAAVEKEYAELLPSSLVLKLDSIEHLEDNSVPLVATFSVTGSLGVSSARRLTLPADLFASETKPILEAATRSAPVAFPAPYVLRDRVTLHYPRELTLEVTPGRKTFSVATDLVYDETVATSKDTIVAQRTFILSRVDYMPDMYPALHKFFAAAADADQEQVVLTKPTIQ